MHVDGHRVLRALLRIGRERVGLGAVFLGRHTPRSCPLDGTRRGHTARAIPGEPELHAHARHGDAAAAQQRAVARPRTQHARRERTIAAALRVEHPRVVHQVHVAVANGLAHGPHPRTMRLAVGLAAKRAEGLVVFERGPRRVVEGHRTHLVVGREPRRGTPIPRRSLIARGRRVRGGPRGVVGEPHEAHGIARNTLFQALCAHRIEGVAEGVEGARTVRGVDAQAHVSARREGHGAAIAHTVVEEHEGAVGRGDGLAEQGVERFQRAGG